MQQEPQYHTTPSPLPPALYLIPSSLSGAEISSAIPSGNLAVMAGIRHFIVENVREARRFIRRCLPEADISAMTFVELNRHTDLSAASEWLAPLRAGLPMGLLSDAGCPAVADPGAIVVSIAQRERLKVTPLVGPSSILLGLMASGFNGQGFCFHGYLPIDDAERAATLRQLESSSERLDMTHIFIETPYRNTRMLRTLASTLKDATRICVACDLTDPQSETVVTMTARQWRSEAEKFDFDKRPAVFLIYSGKTDFADTASGRKNAYRKKR